MNPAFLKSGHFIFLKRGQIRFLLTSVAGRALYSMRLAIGEPPFANMRYAIGLDRFTLRTRRKVDTQWKLFCIVHNLKKIQRYGTGFA
jgi:hypothetical protein